MAPWTAWIVWILHLMMQPTAPSIEADLLLLAPGPSCTPLRAVPLDAQGQPTEAFSHDGPALLRWRGPDIAYLRHYAEAPAQVSAPQQEALCRLDITLEGLHGTPTPPWIEVFVDPASLPDLPEACLSSLRFVQPGVERSYFWRQPARDGHLQLWVPRGSHLVGGSYAPEGDLEGGVLVQEVADSEGLKLDGNPYLGYRVEIQGDTRLVLRYGGI